MMKSERALLVFILGVRQSEKYSKETGFTVSIALR
jgi:hypothetical protein